MALQGFVVVMAVLVTQVTQTRKGSMRQVKKLTIFVIQSDFVRVCPSESFVDE